ncbi:protein CHLOROPLAST J-LIKE DOMAIN 1, chloroplastic isoform X1 [Prosopis cineraria]|uniref:protein CHLOROPLAST J-LIKE DOMAIN 1, chloroplastic isoform X1 n=1 Tax=Prosopis cineraria TaxID=364024 RepID=UPI00240EF5DB|nr:protein CHLOROPLAST J-LIKE DOMAIN 1, chloroplastic isoform X1 [Prosopis cineraria]
MALAMSNLLQCPNLRLSQRNFRPKVSETSLSFVRFSKIDVWSGRRLICAAASAAGSSNSGSDLNPYEVLGVSPIEGFDMIKAAYTKKRKEAERIGDEETAARLEKAYDRVMMAQLTNRKKGVAFGSFKVSKDIKYADKQPIVPWGPRFSKSSKNDMHINLAISAVFTTWVLVRRNAEYKPLQFLAFAFVYRLFEKLKSFEPPVTPTYNEDGEDTGEGLRMGKRLLRSLALVFGCIAVSSLAYTGLLNFIEFSGGYIPALLYNSQELIITTSSAVMLYIMASFYR